MPSTEITYTAQDGLRFAAALGKRHELGRNATEAEAKQWLIAKMKALVREEERRANEAALTDTPWNAT